jgi:hypothetical protein
MGMALTATYPRPKVKKVGYQWQVWFCDSRNTVWYYVAPNWQGAIDYALDIRQSW